MGGDSTEIMIEIIMNISYPDVLRVSYPVAGLRTLISELSVIRMRSESIGRESPEGRVQDLSKGEPRRFILMETLKG